MKKLYRALLPILALAIVPVAVAAEDPLTDHPGFVDFTVLTAIANTEPVVEVTLKEPILNMVTNLIRAEEEAAADFISKLLRVTVDVYDSREIDVDEIADSMETVAADLDDLGWDRVVRVREDEDHADIYIRMSPDGNMIHGIAIMVAEPDETVLVNIVGDISGDDLAAMGRRFDIDELEDLDI